MGNSSLQSVTDSYGEYKLSSNVTEVAPMGNSSLQSVTDSYGEYKLQQ